MLSDVLATMVWVFGALGEMFRLAALPIFVAGGVPAALATQSVIPLLIGPGMWLLGATFTAVERGAQAVLDSRETFKPPSAPSR